VTELKNRCIRLVARPVGHPKPTDFQFDETTIPSLGPGDILVRHLYIALDPALRNWMDDDPDSYIPPVALGDVMGAVCLGQVVDSRDEAYAPGDLTWGIGGWEEYRVANADQLRQNPTIMPLAARDPELPLSNYLSICGTTGLTSYFGVMRVGRPAPGETLLVSGAAGAVGSVAGQIGRQVCGARVVGIAGTDEKCRWLTEELGFDAAINYRTETDMKAAIGAACPDGVDVFFDNVGGETLDAALMHLNFGARVVMCGRISTYDQDYRNRPGPYNLWQLLVKNARIEGFTVAYYHAEWPAVTGILAGWAKRGFVQFREEIVEGLDAILPAFDRLFSGENHGRMIVKLADET